MATAIDGDRTYVSKTSDIPQAEFYVRTRDTFFSNLLRSMIGRHERSNILVFPCASYAEAVKVADYARSRGDQTRVRICERRPRVSYGQYVQVKTRDEYPSWYGLELHD